MNLKISCAVVALVFATGCKHSASNSEAKAVSGPGTGKSFTLIFEGKTQHSLCKSTCSADPSNFNDPGDFLQNCQSKNNYGVSKKQFDTMEFPESKDANLNEMIALFVSKGPEVFSPDDISKVNPNAVPGFKNAVFQLGNEITRRKQTLPDCDFQAYVEKLGSHMTVNSTVTIDSDELSSIPKASETNQAQNAPMKPSPAEEVAGTICASTYRLSSITGKSCVNFTADTEDRARSMCVRYSTGAPWIQNCSPSGQYRCFKYKREVRKSDANMKFYGQGIKNNLAFDTAWERTDGIMVNLYGNQVTPIDCSSKSDKCDSSCAKDF